VYIERAVFRFLAEFVVRNAVQESQNKSTPVECALCEPFLSSIARRLFSVPFSLAISHDQALCFMMDAGSKTAWSEVDAYSCSEWMIEKAQSSP